MEISTILPPAPYPGRVILASNSQRRRDLLHLIVPKFDIAPSRDIIETYPDDLPAVLVPQHLSQLKSAGYADLVSDNTLLITADTVVINDGQILGKPHDAKDACRMLHSLSGHAHRVVTGVTLRTTYGTRSFSETTEVHFAKLSDAEIQQYVNIYRPFDKAGAYGIQEWIGAIGIEDINGCFYNVMGLPLFALNQHIRALP